MTTPTETPETDRLHTLALRVLRAVENAALELSVTLPGKRYVTIGQAAHDCEQVAVVITRLGTGMPDGASGAAIPAGAPGFCAPPWTATLTVEIVRCQPDLPAPNGIVDGAALSAAMRTQSADSAVIREAVAALAGDYDHGFGDVTCSITFPAPTGGMNVTVGTLAVAMP